MSYTYTIPDRKKWQAVRDKAKVPQGAAKVSVGDALARASASWNPANLAKHKAELDKLSQVLDTYGKTIKTKYPKFADGDLHDLIIKVDGHAKTVDRWLEAQKWYPIKYRQIVEMWQQGKTEPKLYIEQLQRCDVHAGLLAAIDPSYANKKKAIADIAKEIRARRFDNLKDLLPKAKP